MRHPWLLLVLGSSCGLGCASAPPTPPSTTPVYGALQPAEPIAVTRVSTDQPAPSHLSTGKQVQSKEGKSPAPEEQSRAAAQPSTPKADASLAEPAKAETAADESPTPPATPPRADSGGDSSPSQGPSQDGK